MYFQIRGSQTVVNKESQAWGSGDFEKDKTGASMI
jgi:hypothetical protein